MKIDSKLMSHARSMVDGCPHEPPLVMRPEDAYSAMVVVGGIVLCAVVLTIAWLVAR